MARSRSGHLHHRAIPADECFDAGHESTLVSAHVYAWEEESCASDGCAVCGCVLRREGWACVECAEGLWYVAWHGCLGGLFEGVEGAVSAWYGGAVGGELRVVGNCGQESSGVVEERRLESKVTVFLQTGKDAAALPLTGTLTVGYYARNCKRSRSSLSLGVIFEM